MVQRVGWLTDIHLDFLKPEQETRFFETLRAAEVDVWLIGGDIAEAPTVCATLRRIAQTLQKPIYFVLGNHDYYKGSIGQVRADVRRLCAEIPSLIYLSDTASVALTPQVRLIGHDGWADLQYGDFKKSSVWMRDYIEIEGLQGLKKIGLLPRMMAFAQEAADHCQRVLPDALQQASNLLVLTHVPPFQEACWHEGKISDWEWLPHFTCQALGKILWAAMQAHPAQRMTVLCGHTHGSGRADILPNLRVITGGAEYGSPMIQKIFTLQD
jgi:3',5'-cyclic-AMP phosphodiesterase